MAAPRSYEIRLFDQTLVAFSISDGIFSPEVKLQDFDNASSALDAFLRERAEMLAAVPEVDFEELKSALKATAPHRSEESDGAFRL